MPFMFNPCRPCCSPMTCRCYQVTFDPPSPYVPNYVWSGGSFPIITNSNTYPSPIQSYRMIETPLLIYQQWDARNQYSTWTYPLSGNSHLSMFRMTMTSVPDGSGVRAVLRIVWDVPTTQQIDDLLSGAGLPDPPPWGANPGSGNYEAYYENVTHPNASAAWCQSRRFELFDNEDAPAHEDPEGGTVEWSQYVTVTEIPCIHCLCNVPVDATSSSSGFNMSSYTQVGIQNKITCESATPAFTFDDVRQRLLLRTAGVTAGDDLEEYEDNGSAYVTQSFSAPPNHWYWKFMARVVLATGLPTDVGGGVIEPLPEDDYPDGWNRFSDKEIKGAGIFIGNVGALMLVRTSEAPYIRIRFVPFVTDIGEWVDVDTAAVCGGGYVEPETFADQQSDNILTHDVDYGKNTIRQMCLTIEVRRRNGLHFQIIGYYGGELTGSASNQLFSRRVTLPAAPQNYGFIGFGGAKWTESCFYEGPWYDCGMCEGTNFEKPGSWMFSAGPNGEQNLFLSGLGSFCQTFNNVIFGNFENTAFALQRQCIPGLPPLYSGTDLCRWSYNALGGITRLFSMDYNESQQNTVTLSLLFSGGGLSDNYHAATYTAPYDAVMCGAGGAGLATQIEFTLLGFGSGGGNGQGVITPSDPPEELCPTMSWPTTTYMIAF